MVGRSAAHPDGMRLWNQVSKLLGMEVKDTCRNGMRVRIELKVFNGLNIDNLIVEKVFSHDKKNTEPFTVTSMTQI